MNETRLDHSRQNESIYLRETRQGNLSTLRLSQTQVSTCINAKHAHRHGGTAQNRIILNGLVAFSESSSSSAADADQLAERKKSSSKLNFAIGSFFAGGIAGCCAKTAIAPLDRLKILLQAKNAHYAHHGITSGLIAIGKKEGFSGYYKGNGAMMARIFPYASVQFMSYEQYKKLFLWLNDGKETGLQKLFSGSLAGITSVAATYPLDLVRARLAFQVSETQYTGIIQAFRVILKNEGGIPAVYRGFVATVSGMIPYAGLSFFTYETLKSFFLHHPSEWFTKPYVDPKTKTIDTTLRELTYTSNLLCGGVAGGVGQTVAYPLDVVRRRMQLNKALPKFDNLTTIRSLIYILKTDGFFGGWYRGMSLNYLRVMPQVAVSFTTYEFLKSMFKIESKSVVKVG